MGSVGFSGLYKHRLAILSLVTPGLTCLPGPSSLRTLNFSFLFSPFCLGMCDIYLHPPSKAAARKSTQPRGPATSHKDLLFVIANIEQRGGENSRDGCRGVWELAETGGEWAGTGKIDYAA